MALTLRLHITLQEIRTAVAATIVAAGATVRGPRTSSKVALMPVIPRRFALSAILAFLVLSSSARAQGGDDPLSCSMADMGGYADSVIAACTRLISSGRESGDVLIETLRRRAVAYSHKGDYYRAIRDYAEAIRRDPTNAELYASRGQAFLQLADYDRAIQDLTEALRLEPTNAGLYVLRGKAFYTAGAYDRAIQDYDRAIQRGQPDPAVLYSRGLAFTASANYDRAIRDYEEVIRLDPANTNAWSSRAWAYASEGAYDRAVQDFDEAIRQSPGFAGAFTGRGLARFAEGHYFAAATDFANGAKADSTYLYNFIWLYLAQQRAGEKSGASLPDPQRHDLKDWPGPVITFYQGSITASALLSAAADRDSVRASLQRCEARVYMGEADLLIGRREAALNEFRIAADSCPRYFIEYVAARFEMKHLSE